MTNITSAMILKILFLIIGGLFCLHAVFQFPHEVSAAGSNISEAQTIVSSVCDIMPYSTVVDCVAMRRLSKRNYLELALVNTAKHMWNHLPSFVSGQTIETIAANAWAISFLIIAFAIVVSAIWSTLQPIAHFLQLSFTSSSSTADDSATSVASRAEDGGAGEPSDEGQSSRLRKLIEGMKQAATGPHAKKAC